MQKTLRELPDEYEFLPQIGGRDVLLEQSTKDFSFVIVNKRLFNLCKRGLHDVIGFDAIHKLIEDRVEGAIPLHGLTAMDEHRQSRVPFVCMTSHADSERYVPMLRAIGEYIVKNGGVVASYDEWKERITFMVDDGSAETKTLTLLGLDYVLCAFHVLKAITTWTDRTSNHTRHNVPIVRFKELKGIIYRMLTCTTEASYWKLYDELERKFPDFVSEYFANTWHLPKHGEEHYFFFHWTSIKRRNCYNLWWVNNNAENVYKNWTERKGARKCKRIDTGIEFAISLVKEATYSYTVNGNTKTANGTTEKSIRANDFSLNLGISFEL